MQLIAEKVRSMKNCKSDFSLRRSIFFRRYSLFFDGKILLRSTKGHSVNFYTRTPYFFSGIARLKVQALLMYKISLGWTDTYVFNAPFREWEGNVEHDTDKQVGANDCSKGDWNVSFLEGEKEKSLGSPCSAASIFHFLHSNFMELRINKHPQTRGKTLRCFLGACCFYRWWWWRCGWRGPRPAFHSSWERRTWTRERNRPKLRLGSLRWCPTCKTSSKSKTKWSPPTTNLWNSQVRITILKNDMKMTWSIPPYK